MHANSLKNIGHGRNSKNKFTQLKESFLFAFNKIGGQKELAAWAILPRNRDKFYELVIRLLPKEMKIEGDVNLGTRVIYLPQRQFHDGEVVTIETKQAITTPDNGDSVPLLEHKKEDIKKAI